MIWLALGLATVASCLLLGRLPIMARIGRATGYARRSVRLIGNPAVSDHWKERVLPRYAGRLALDSVTAFGLILTAVIPFLLLVGVSGLLGSDMLAVLLSWQGIAWVMAVALVFFALMRLVRGGETKPASAVDASGYSPLSRILHRLALARPQQVEMLFDIETATAPLPPLAAGEGRHVFVAGLARAGTTVLMRAIHAGGAFASLTYRDMPFVVAPNLWGRLSGRSRREMAQTERAHGDRLLVDFDSPEALEEPFWRAFCGADYIRPDALVPHTVDEATIAKYRSFVAHVLARHGRARYLAKNNNAVLRLGALLHAFPAAVILVPFRDPLAQSRSLQRQHARFEASTDPFVRDYMTWLVHHEFGQDHRPYVIEGERPAGTPATLDYWLAMWIRVYRHLLTQATGADAVQPVAYEDLCAADGAVWQALRRRIDVPPGEVAFEAAAVPEPPAVEPALLAEARSIYGALRDLSRQRLALPATVPVAS